MNNIKNYTNPNFKCSDKNRLLTVLGIFVLGTIITAFIMYKTNEKINGLSSSVGSIQEDVKTLQIVLQEYSETTSDLTLVVSEISKKSNSVVKIETRLDNLEKKVTQLEGLKKIISN